MVFTNLTHYYGIVLIEVINWIRGKRQVDKDILVFS
jgi:hypothetical protein